MTGPEDVLSPATRQAVGEFGRADVVVGIPSYNNARTIGHVVNAAQAGLAKYFPDLRCIVLNSDGGSSDGTPDVVQGAALGDGHLLLLAHPMFPVHRLSLPYQGDPGEGQRLPHDLPGRRAARRAGLRGRGFRPAEHHARVDSASRQAGAAARLRLRGALYLRHKFDGTITNSIVYPLTTALYGVRIRQPIGGDFGFSGRLATHYLSKDVWETDVARYGIDVWMTTTAICDGFRVCQSFLGAKIHDAKDPGADLSAMLVQVVGTVFGLMETTSRRGRRSRRPPTRRCSGSGTGSDSSRSRWTRSG